MSGRARANARAVWKKKRGERARGAYAWFGGPTGKKTGSVSNNSDSITRSCCCTISFLLAGGWRAIWRDSSTSASMARREHAKFGCDPDPPPLPRVTSARNLSTRSEGVGVVPVAGAADAASSVTGDALTTSRAGSFLRRRNSRNMAAAGETWRKARGCDAHDARPLWLQQSALRLRQRLRTRSGRRLRDPRRRRRRQCRRASRC